MKRENVVYWNFYNPKSLPIINLSRLLISHLEVEDIIIEIGSPGGNYELYKKKDRYFLDTVHDSQGKINHERDKVFESEEQIIAYTDAVKQYIETDGQAFIDRYSYLPNVLEEMDRLESEGKDWNGILGGYGDRLFRALIIAKLCNDSSYSKKEAYCDAKFTSVAILQSWQPYYHRLKERISFLHPQYNL